jgi:hypothetical protein
MAHMQKLSKPMNGAGGPALSQADFMRRANIAPELAEFVNEFIESYEISYSMSQERRCEIENQLDAVLSSIARLCSMRPRSGTLAGQKPAGMEG